MTPENEARSAVKNSRGNCVRLLVIGELMGGEKSARELRSALERASGVDWTLTFVPVMSGLQSEGYVLRHRVVGGGGEEGPVTREAFYRVTPEGERFYRESAAEAGADTGHGFWWYVRDFLDFAAGDFRLPGPWTLLVILSFLAAAGGLLGYLGSLGR